jgi:hypothetical protein
MISQAFCGTMYRAFQVRRFVRTIYRLETVIMISVVIEYVLLVIVMCEDGDHLVWA